jgi:hypothetical protein
VRFAACSDISPAPPISHAPDTTSHDWTFTMYEVGGMNTTLEDVFALSPDYALAVGKIERTGPYIRPQVNAFLWKRQRSYADKPADRSERYSDDRSA